MKMKNLNLFVICLLFFYALSFWHMARPKNTDVKKTEISEVSEKESEEETKKHLSNLKIKIKNPILSKVIKLAENVTNQIKMDIKMPEVTSFLNVPNGKVKNYLDKFVISTPVVNATESGMNIEGKITVNDNPLSAFLEIGKTEDGDWFLSFYIKSPKKWKLSDYFPGFLPTAKLFPKASPKLLEEPDFIELEQAYFYITTVKTKEFPANVGFKGKARFIGYFDLFDKLFGLKGDPLEVEGRINMPSFAGSEFSIKVPTQAMVLPEAVVLKKLKGLKVPIPVEGIKLSEKEKYKNYKIWSMIPGVWVSLAPFEFKIKMHDIRPSLDIVGALRVKTPLYKKPLEFFAGMDIYGDRLKLSGGQREDLINFLGIKDVVLKNGKITIIWDFTVTGQIAAELAAPTALLSSLILLLPVGAGFKGGISSGKSSLDLDIEGSLHGTRGVDWKWISKGSFESKKFAEFLLRQVFKFKKQEEIDEGLKKVPNFFLYDVSIDAAFSEDEEKKFNVFAKKIDLGKGLFANDLNLSMSQNGFKGKGSLNRFAIPSSGKPIFEITSKDKEKGLSFDIAITHSPFNFDIDLDGSLNANLGVLGEVEGSSKASVTLTSLNIDSKIKVFGSESIAKVTGDCDKDGNVDLETLFLDLSFTKEGLDKLAERFRDYGKVVSFDYKQYLDEQKNIALAEIEGGKLSGFIAGTQKEIEKQDAKIEADKEECEKEKTLLAKQWCYFKKGTEAKKAKKNLLKLHKKNLENLQKAANVAVKIGNKILRSSADITAYFSRRIAETSSLLGKFEKKVFRLDRVRLFAKVKDLEKFKLPEFEIKGSVLGQDFNLKLGIDLSQPYEAVKKILQNVGLIKRKEGIVVAS